jgi:transcriptional regulator with XRE-family HTH domain
MDTPSLLASVLAGLQEHKGRWPDLARAAGVEYSWLTKLAQGRISDPGIQKIQRLADAMGRERAGPAPSDTAAA